VDYNKFLPLKSPSNAPKEKENNIEKNPLKKSKSSGVIKTKFNDGDKLSSLKSHVSQSSTLPEIKNPLTKTPTYSRPKKVEISPDTPPGSTRKKKDNLSPSVPVQVSSPKNKKVIEKKNAKKNP